MADAPPPEDSYKLPDHAHRYKFPPVKNMDDVNQNFEEAGDLFSRIILEIRESQEANHLSLLRLAEETSQNISKLTSEMKSVIGSQTMMFVILFTIGALAIVSLKTVYEMIFSPIG